MILFTNKKSFSLFIFFLIIVLPINLNSQSILFNHLTTNNGLSNNYVSDIFQDRYGFLWFATDDGLNRFDGYEFKIYRNNPQDKNSISDNTILSFSEDAKGNLWIGTKNGFVNRYDPILDRFTKWEIKSDITKENPIYVLYVDKNNLVWIGTYRSGLYRLNPESDKIDHWLFDANNSASLSSNFISSIVEDELGNFWIGTYSGLNKLSPDKYSFKFERFYSEKKNPNSLSDNLIWNLTQSSSDKNKFFIGTANGITVLHTKQEIFERLQVYNPDNLQFGTGAGVVLEENINDQQIIWTNSYAGLIRYNLTENKFYRYLPDKTNPNTIASYQINKIFKDRSGVLWAATNKGMSYFTQKYNKLNNPFFTRQFDFESDKLNFQNSTAILKSQDGVLLVGTDNGLYFSSLINGRYELKKHPGLSKENIWSLAQDKFDNIWVGTYGEGLFQLNLKSKNVVKRDILKNIISLPPRNFIKSLLTDNKNNLWLGTWGAGLARMNFSTNEVKHFHHLNNDIKSISHDDIWVIYQDSKSRIWIGTNGGGLDLFDQSNGGMFYRINSESQNQPGLNSNSIYSICESLINTNSDNETTLWIGTNNGLNKIVIDNLSFKYSPVPKIKKAINYTIQNGLADNSIKTIVEDGNGNLWLGTSSGITLYDLKKNVFINFNSADGVIGNDFNFSSGLKYDDDLIALGSTTGLNYFNPKSIEQSSYNPVVMITDFLIFNKSIKPSSTSVLANTIFSTDVITLSHTQNVFSFQFAALDYNNPGSIIYSYMMEGFDKDWIQSGSRRFITYTNLNPGSYTFKVKSTNSDGIWGDKITLVKVIITPPWWQTIWAIILYFLIFVFGIWAIVKFQSNRTRLQQELKMREFEAYHLREVEQMKSRFFANISHEFRTPLMLIKGPIEELLRGRIKENLKDYYLMLLRNTEKLQQLIDQLLELSQLESESIPLKTECYDLVSLVKSFSNSFLPLAEQKSITLNFNVTVDLAFAMLDKDKFEKIINNLLSNAFKFTDVGGIVSVEISETNNAEKKLAIISISDSGIGIAGKNQSKIFDRFFQVDDSSKRNFGGSGIGLALVKELTTLHNWDIGVNSKEGEGTEFLIKIPLLTEDEYKKYKSTVSEIKKDFNNEFVEKKNEINLEKSSNKSKSLILFVEDSSEVRNYVQDLLKQDYNVLQAENGASGFEIAINNMPDLIISDVMMPIMDGFELCKKVKTDWKTSHIPVILLTAKSTHQSKLEGLGLGADDYLTKPFDFEELSIRINNLIQQRKLLREKFSKEINANAESITTNSFDKEFVEKIIKIIETHLQNENFTSESLSEELFVSRSQLNRKLNAITGQGPGEFIRIYKLKRAAQMILENKLSITQIALEVGFSSPAQFTRAFQKHFNCLPSEFHLTNQN
jgi:signal transduction histidine kinase/ligand-binding sensor domain-containing protein/DNA-binding response OmpR family regulator